MSTQPKSLREHPFTLIELMIVIAIIAILIAMLLPALTRAKRSAFMAVGLSNQHQVFLGMTMFAEDHDANYTQPTGSDPWYGYMAGSKPYVYMEPKHIGNLWADDYVTALDVFYCPLANRSDKEGVRLKDYQERTAGPDYGRWKRHSGPHFGGNYSRAGFQINSLHYQKVGNLDHGTAAAIHDFSSGVNRAPFIHDWITKEFWIAHGPDWNVTMIDGSARTRRSRALQASMLAGEDRYGNDWGLQSWALNELLKD